MKNLFVLVSIFLGSIPALADLTPQEIRDRLELRSDVYLMDSTGKRVLKGHIHTNYWRLNKESKKIEANWSSRFDDSNEVVAFRVESEVLDDGQIKLVLKEFGNDTDKGDLKNLVESKEILVENLAPVVWPVKHIKSKNYVVRFIFSLREQSTPVSVDSLPIAGSDISVYDNHGFLWAESILLNGKYTGFKSHRGTLMLSYSPFKGGEELGVAEGNLITLNLDKRFAVYLKSKADFLPVGVTAKVYALFKKDRRSGGFSSLHSFDTSDVNRALDNIK